MDSVGLATELLFMVPTPLTFNTPSRLFLFFGESDQSRVLLGGGGVIMGNASLFFSSFSMLI